MSAKRTKISQKVEFKILTEEEIMALIEDILSNEGSVIQALPKPDTDAKSVVLCTPFPI